MSNCRTTKGKFKRCSTGSRAAADKTETKIAKLLAYSFADIRGFDELTSREKKIVGNATSFAKIKAWMRRHH